jgi:protein TonB
MKRVKQIKNLSIVFLLIVLLSQTNFSQEVVNQDNQLIAANFADTTVHLTAEKMPEPIGGIETIAKRLVYPQIAKYAGIQGKVFVSAVIDENGNVIETGILKGIGVGCDEAAMEAIKSTKFIAGTNSGKPVKVKVVIPLIFKLSDKDKSDVIEKHPNDKKKIEENLFFRSIYLSVDVMPEPIGGISEIMKKITYPEEAKKNGIQGKVFVTAIIDETGKVMETSIEKGIGSGCDEVAEKAIAQTSFTPGLLDGKKVKVRVVIPIMFKLN